MENFKYLIEEKTDNELIRIVKNREDYLPEFAQYAEEELTKRNIPIDNLPEIEEEPTEDSEKTSAKATSVSGWLLFFLFTVGGGAMFTVIIGFAQFSFSDYEELSPLSRNLAIIYDMFSLAFIGCLAAYTIKSFLELKPNAVFLGKTYLIVICISNLLLLMMGGYEKSGFGSLNYLVRSLIYCLIWFCYLLVSKQVNGLFPIRKRVILKRDKYLIGAMVVISALFFMVAMISPY